MVEEPEHTLVERASQGDGAALDVLLVDHLPALLAYVRLHADPVIRRHESCSDLVQSVCREALEDLGDFEYRGEPQFRKWLFTRVMAKLVNRKRYYLAQKRNYGRQEPLTHAEARSGLEALYATMCSPSQGAIAHETAARLERAFDQLPEDCQRVITLARVIGMSRAEIAEELGRPESTVRVLLHRALVRLGKLMSEDPAGRRR